MKFISQNPSPGVSPKGAVLVTADSISLRSIRADNCRSIPDNQLELFFKLKRFKFYQNPHLFENHCHYVHHY